MEHLVFKENSSLPCKTNETKQIMFYIINVVERDKGFRRRKRFYRLENRHMRLFYH